MHSLFGDILTHALAVAISPEPILAVILMLFTPRARSNSLAFFCGWIAGLLAVTFAVLASGFFVSDRVAQSGGGPLMGWAKLGLGLLLIGLAARRWKRRPRGDQPAREPAWLAVVERFRLARAATLGFALSAINPKNLVLTALSASHIAAANFSVIGDIAATTAFIVIACSTVVAPIIAYHLMGTRADPHLQSARRWLIANNNTILIVIFLIFGVKFVGNGIGMLTT